MIRLNLFLSVLFMAVIALSLSSCNINEYEPTAYGDVLVKSVQSGDSVLYGTYFFVYSWDKMQKATVRRSGDSLRIVLDSVDYRYTFVHTPDSSEFLTVKPSRGTYIFDVLFDDGQEYEVADFLDSTFLTPPVIKEFRFDTEEEKIVLDWESNTLVDQYRVNIKNEQNEIVFQSIFLYPYQSSISITAGTNGWATLAVPKENANYTVSVFAYRYEPIASAFDVQSISETKAGTIQWIKK